MWVTGMALAHMHACRESFLRQLLTTQRSEKERVTNQIKEFQNGSKIKKKKIKKKRSQVTASAAPSHRGYRSNDVQNLLLVTGLHPDRGRNQKRRRKRRTRRRVNTRQTHHTGWK